MSEIGLRAGNDQAVLTLRGAIEAPSICELLAAAVSACASGKPVLVDWSEAEHLHAGALQVLMALKAELTAQERPLRVSDSSEAVRDCIGAAGLAEWFPSQLPIGTGTKEDRLANGTDRG